MKKNNFIVINDEGGKIGNIWWINSSRMPPWIQQFKESSNIRWGEFGFGPKKLSNNFKEDVISAYYIIFHDSEVFRKYSNELELIKNFISNSKK